MPQQKILTEEMGWRYIRDFFTEAYFVVGNRLHKVFATDEENKVIHTKSIDLREQNPKWASDKVAPEVLVDFTTFKFPKLGYRQFKHGKVGNIVAMASTQRNAARGLKDSIILWQPLPVYTAVAYDNEGFEGVNTARRAKEIFAPTFTQFSVGIKELLDGKSAGFAVNEDLAVGISCDTDPVRGYDVYFRGRVVGNVSEDGTLNITNKILQRDSLKSKLFR